MRLGHLGLGLSAAGPGAASYGARVRDTRPENLLGYWPLTDRTGTAVADASGNGRDGAFLFDEAAHEIGGHVGDGVGDGRTGLALNGAHTVVNLYSEGLAAAFSGSTGSLMVWVKPATPGVWLDGVIRRIAVLRSSESNDISLYKGAEAGNLVASYTTGGTTRIANVLENAWDDWRQLAFTWDKAADVCRLYMNGFQVGTDVSGLGEWAGTLAPGFTALGSLGSYPNGVWWGGIAHGALWNAALTPAEVKALWRGVRGLPDGKAVFFGDSITAGEGASDEGHCYANLVAAGAGWPSFANEGVAGTVLQNAAAPANNGRDSYPQRVLKHEPSYVVIVYGTNDYAYNNAGFSDACFRHELGEIVDGIVTNGTPATRVVIGSPPYATPASYAGRWHPYDTGSAEKHAAYVAAAAGAASDKGTKYVDLYAYMAAHGGDALMDSDGYHPNDSGHAAIAAAILSVL